MNRATDEEIRVFAGGAFELAEEDVADVVAELAAEVLEARERGTTGTVDNLTANRA